MLITFFCNLIQFFFFSFLLFWFIHSNSSGSKETSTTASGNGSGNGGSRGAAETIGNSAQERTPTVAAVHDSYDDLMNLLIEASHSGRNDNDNDNNPSLSELMDIKIR